MFGKQGQDYAVMKDLKGYFTLDQIDRMIANAGCQRNMLLLRILSRTGRRISEVIGRSKYVNRNANKGIEKEYQAVVGIRPIDINWEESLIAFPILKKKRIVRKLKPIDKTSLKMLKVYIEHKKIEPEAPVFDIGRFMAYKIVRRCAANAGIRFIGEKSPHPHHFRHSFAIQVLKHSKNPSDIKKLQMALEHSDLNVTSGYLQFAQEELKEMIDNAFGDDKDELETDEREDQARPDKIPAEVQSDGGESQRQDAGNPDKAQGEVKEGGIDD